MGLRARVLAAVLAVVAVLEVAVRAERFDPVSVAMLLAVGATVPLALPPRPAAAVVTVANLLTVLSYARLTFAGIAAELVVTYLLGQTLVRGARRKAVERHATDRAFADSLLEHAARGERARIARELHDVVAHHISMIAVQAETARLTTPGMPADGQKRLLAIGDTARAALTEMRRLLGVLREDASTDAAGPSRAPQPGLRQLNELLDEVRESTRAGTRLLVRGPVRPLEPGVELTAYRIVQEALTNVRRHAPGAAVDVDLEYTADTLRVSVRDNGPGAADRYRAGLGHLGMRERTAALGGWLRTGPAPGSGFMVEAAIPVGPDTREDRRPGDGVTG